MLLLPLLLGFLALAIITVHGLFVRERTPLPALAAAGATGAVILDLYRFYLGVVEADEQGTTVDFDALDAALLFGGAGTVIALAPGSGASEPARCADVPADEPTRVDGKPTAGRGSCYRGGDVRGCTPRRC